VLVDSQQWLAAKAEIRKTAEAGYAKVINPYLPDVTDLSCPVFHNGQFAAALTLPYIKTHKGPHLIWCLAALQRAAEDIHTSLKREILVA
ncbi:MAG: hypothetical protein WBQ60_02635, partial [Asticcacaulis sp.]